MAQGLEELAPVDHSLAKEHEESTKIKNIQVSALLWNFFIFEEIASYVLTFSGSEVWQV